MDPNCVSDDTVKRLPGTLKSIRIHQLAFLFRVATSVLQQSSVNGHYLADSVGNGKTIAMLALFVLKRIVQLNRDHIDSHPELHLSEGQRERGDRCPLGDSFGIQCLCEPGNPLAEYEAHMARGFDLQVVTRQLEAAWCDEYQAYVDTIINDTSNPLYGEPVLHGYVIDTDRGLLAMRETSPALTFKDLHIKVRYKPTNRQYVTVNPGEKLLYFDQYVSKSSAAASSPWSGPSVKVWVKEKGSNPKQHHVIPRALVSPSSISIDEYHQCDGRNNKFNEAIRAICTRTQPCSQPRPWVFFQSGTPFQKGATDLCASHEIIQCDVAKSRLFDEAMKEVSRQQRQGIHDDEDNETAAVIMQAVRHISPWVTARAPGSPILAGSRLSRQLPPYLRTCLNFKTPQQRQAAYHGHVEQARNEIAAAMSASAAGGLWPLLSVNQDFPWRADAVNRDLSNEDDSLYFRHVEDYTGNDPMFAKLETIIRDASQGVVNHRNTRHSDSRPFHVLLYAAFPATAAASYAFLKTKCSRFAEPVLASSNLTPPKRVELIQHMSDRARVLERDGIPKSIVLVTTFGAMGTGSNQLVFCNVMVKFGEPWLATETEQAIGRLQREGQLRQVHVLDFFRDDNDAETLIRERNRIRDRILSNKRLSGNRLLPNLPLS
ncbi:hypothetical protein FALBO_15830 [Fusarium albosuccineum]|uniref:Helicase C-terminal domain-containing protein n=1 Tax=Fusarium albosuccineum TaxID=1237068 RepID=A0A8H4KRG8_9HYPO|nr:hypothetical protein FALBO_15830 [Fusarium albosuccineum]